MEKSKEDLTQIVKQSDNYIIAQKQIGNPVPLVIDSNHEKYVKDTKLDHGFLNTAINKDSYSVLLLPCKEAKNYIIARPINPNNEGDVNLAKGYRKLHQETIFGFTKETNHPDFYENKPVKQSDLSINYDTVDTSFLFDSNNKKD